MEIKQLDFPGVIETVAAELRLGNLRPVEAIQAIVKAYQANRNADPSISTLVVVGDNSAGRNRDALAKAPVDRLAHRPPKQLFAPVLHDMLESAMIMSAATGSVGGTHEEKVGEFVMKASFQIARPNHPEFKQLQARDGWPDRSY